ncbi:glutathione S-transferase alpha-5-like [Clytia hemisphaerica]
MAATTKYVHHYFKTAARGDPIRLAFCAAGVDFEDKTYTFADMPTIKGDEKTFPLGQVPALEIDGESYVQSHAILRYIGNEFDLYGMCNKQKLVIDEILYTLQNIDEQLLGTYFFTKKAQKEEKFKKIHDYAARAYKMFEGILQKNNNGKDYFVGNKLSIADLHLVSSLETMSLEENTFPGFKNFIDNYPLVKALNERVRNVESVKKFLEKRGTPFYGMQREMAAKNGY